MRKAVNIIENNLTVSVYSLGFLFFSPLDQPTFPVFSADVVGAG